MEAAAAGAIILHGIADEDLLVPHQPFVTALGHLLASLRRTSSTATWCPGPPIWLRWPPG